MAETANVAKKGTDPKMIVFAAVVIVAALAAIGYYAGFFGGAAALPAQPNPALPLATPEARLLLASYEKSAALSSYAMNWSVDENGVKTNYVVAKNGNDSYVSVQGTFGRMYGFFGKDNKTDVVCLDYGGQAKCAATGNRSDMTDIAASLKIWKPNPIASNNQRDETRKLISIGVIKISKGIANEKVGDFDTQKITYTLDYSNLTVQQMVSLGISPSNENPLAVTGVEFWLDNKTGLVVKSRASYNASGAPMYYEGVYTGIDTTGGTVPQKPGTLIAADAFVEFYSTSTKDFSERSACFAMKGAEKATCLQSIAANRGDWETCKLIGTQPEYEKCSVIVAQETRNSVICGKLALLADDCYIAVASETGNFDLCKSVKNGSLSSNCIAAATAGQKKMEAASVLAANARTSRNCVEDKNCGAFGNAGQYCAPKNTTALFGNDTSPIYACLKGTPCSCLQGYCGFAKNETYYACMNKVEDEELRAYINHLIPANSSIANVTKKISVG